MIQDDTQRVSSFHSTTVLGFTWKPPTNNNNSTIFIKTWQSWSCYGKETAGPDLDWLTYNSGMGIESLRLSLWEKLEDPTSSPLFSEQE